MGKQPIVAAVLGCVACASAADTSETDVEDDGACGEVSAWDVTVRGAVVDGSGGPVAGAAVRLDDMGWNPGTTLGDGTTDGSGAFEFLADDVTSVDGCWGTLLDYVVRAELGDAAAERDVNTPLYNAIQDGTRVMDITGAPLELDAEDE